jgi:hypothetical protein
MGGRWNLTRSGGFFMNIGTFIVDVICAIENWL